jgi:hypothetical protein
MTADSSIHAAADQLRRIIDALESREQRARGLLEHVPSPDDRALRQIAELALSHLGGCR